MFTGFVLIMLQLYFNFRDLPERNMILLRTPLLNVVGTDTSVSSNQIPEHKQKKIKKNLWFKYLKLMCSS